MPHIKQLGVNRRGRQAVAFRMSSSEWKGVKGGCRRAKRPSRFAYLPLLCFLLVFELTAGEIRTEPPSPGQPRLIRHGRLLSHPATQPEGTSKPVSYEIGKMLQLDREHVLLTASMREQGGQDFCVGNDGFVFRDISEIAVERAVPLNRPDPQYRLKSGRGGGVQAKYPGTGAFVPLGTKRADGSPHPGAGSGFYLSTTGTFLSDRSRVHPQADWWLEFLQLTWDGHTLKVAKDALPERVFGLKLINIGFRTYPEGDGFLCPVVSDQGIVVLRFAHRDGRWVAAESGATFGKAGKESEPSIVRVQSEYLVYTRGSDSRGRVYASSNGLHYHFLFQHTNNNVPQVLNQGLDGSLYLAANTSPGVLRNPLFAFVLQEQSFTRPMVIHDEQGMHEDLSREKPARSVPLVDHGVGANVFFGGRWRHVLCYRVCDVRETNGQAAPPTPRTGLYLAEFEYPLLTNMSSIGTEPPAGSP